MDRFGKAAGGVRGFRSVYLGLLFNCMIMATVNLAACKIAGVLFGLDPEAAPRTWPEVEAAAKKLLAAGAPAPDFTALKADNTPVKLSDFRGKIVLVDFWATWCGPCIKEIPEYAEFYRKNQPRGIEVIGIVMDSGSPQEIVDFVREYVGLHVCSLLFANLFYQLLDTFRVRQLRSRQALGVSRLPGGLRAEEDDSRRHHDAAAVGAAGDVRILSSFTMPHRRKVALLIETSNTYTRELLHGVRTRLRERIPWRIRLSEQGRGAGLPVARLRHRVRAQCGRRQPGAAPRLGQ